MLKIRGSQLKPGMQPPCLSNPARLKVQIPGVCMPAYQAAPGTERDGLALAADEIILPGSRRATYERSLPFAFGASLQNSLANRN